MNIVKFETLESKLIKLKDCFVFIDKDISALYDIEPKRLKEQLKRNIEKFPEDYAYQLTDEELETMVSQNATPSKQAFGVYYV